MLLLHRFGKWPCSFFVLLIISSCRSTTSSDDGYINYEKWNSIDGYQYRAFSEKPKEVLDSTFSNLEDTVLSANGSFDDYSLLKFDAAGNLIFHRLFLDSNYVTDFVTDYNDDGKKTTIISYKQFPDSALDSSIRRSVKEKENVFRVTTGSAETAGSKESKLVIFLPDENAMREEEWVNNKLESSVTLFYKNGLTIRQKKDIPGLGSAEWLYYRSAKGHLDSIIGSVNGEVKTKELYFNNEQGDPVLFQKIENNVVEVEARFKYEYDVKGNWTRRLAYSSSRNEGILRNDSVNKKNPRYWLVRRHITY